MKLLNKIYKYLLPGIFQFTICGVFLIFILLYKFFNLPSPFELSLIIEQLFSEYGWSILFIAAFFEGVFIFGMYFPGSLAIALAVNILGKSPIDLIYIASISIAGFLLANTCNYFLGKYGYYKVILLFGKKDTIDNMYLTMAKHGKKVFFITGVFPNLIAITSVCAGMTKMNFFHTIVQIFLSLTFWVSCWTILASLIFKQIDIKDNNQALYLLTFIFLWGIFIVVKERICIK